MGRRERPLDPADGPVHRFAAELRALRRAAGNPTYRELASSSHYSPSALSRAASGQFMPSLEVTLAFVAACHGDTREWRIRWQELATATGNGFEASGMVTSAAGTPATAAETGFAAKSGLASAGAPPRPVAPGAALPGPDAAVAAITSARTAGTTATTGAADSGPRPLAAPASLRRRPGSPGRWLALSAACATALAAGGTLVWVVRAPEASAGHPAASNPSAVTAQPQSEGLAAQPVVDGMDPKRSGCAPDGVTIDSLPLIFPARRLAGTVELRYSRRCAVAWTRFTPAPTGRGANDTVTVEVFRPADGVRIPFTISYSDEAVYSDVLLVSRGCVMAEAQLVTGGRKSPLVASACMSGPGRHSGA